MLMSADDNRLAIEQLQQGLVQHRAGQLGLAASHYQRAATLDPNNPNAWHLLGVTALQADNLPLAVEHFGRCIETAPDFAEAHNNLGVALRRMGQHEDSIAAFRGALNARERYIEAALNLGLAHESAGQPAQAERAYGQALQWRPEDFNAASNLGNLLRRVGRLDDALPWLELARRLQPDSAQANGNLALLLTDLGRFREAVQLAQAAAEIESDKPEWWGALGVAERLQRNIAPAIAALRKAVDLSPDDEGSLSELSLAMGEAGAIDESRAILARFKPGGRHAERMRWTMALSLPSVYTSEAQVDSERGRFSRGLDEIAGKLELDTPTQKQSAYEAVCGVATFLLHYQGRNNTELQNRFGDLVTRVMAARAPRYMQPCGWRATAHGGRLRIGIVSSHLMHHTVSRYFRILLAGLDPARFDVRVWYSGEMRDASTDYIAARVSEFEHVNEDALATAARIRVAELDVLVYPEIGMDPRHNVLGALRLAPVQCVLYGHPITSGLQNIDYFLSGKALEPHDAAAHYREDLALLPGLGACPERPPAAGSGAWLDRFSSPALLLLCLQNHLKLVPAFDQTLAQIAAQTRARIGFFIRDPVVGQLFRTRIEGVFSQWGLDPRLSLVFVPSQSYEAYLGAIERATLVLDSPGFSGGATSLDAFSAGAPVLTHQGEMARGRQTAGMLEMMRIDGLTAKSDSEYVAMAANLVGDPAARAAFRQTIIERSHVLFEHQSVISAFSEFLQRAAEKAATD
jgi:protein O-GlcNAc transferase